MLLIVDVLQCRVLTGNPLSHRFAPLSEPTMRLEFFETLSYFQQAAGDLFVNIVTDADDILRNFLEISINVRLSEMSGSVGLIEHCSSGDIFHRLIFFGSSTSLVR